MDSGKSQAYRCQGVMTQGKAKRAPAWMHGIVALILGGAVPAVVSAQQAVTTLVFDGVTVVDVEQGELVSGQRVVIMGSRIAAVGSTGAIEIPRGARVVDARGKYLIPGLWNMHSHAILNLRNAVLDEFPKFIATGVTGIREAAGAPVPLSTLHQWRREVDAGRRVGPHMTLASPIINTREMGDSIMMASLPNIALRRLVPPSELHSLDSLSQAGIADERLDAALDSLVLAHQDRLLPLIDSLKASGADFLKMYDLSPRMYFVVAAAARRAGIAFGGHLTREVAAIAASDSGATILDHMNAAGDLSQLCWGPTADLARCRATAERFRRNGTWWVPTLAVQSGYGSLPPIFKPRCTPAWKNDPAHCAADSLGLLRMAHRVGMPILAGTDIDPSHGDSGLHRELASMVAEGLTPREALQSATLNPAKYLHATDSLGTVAPDKRADLVLLDANPLADITNTTTIRAVVANGRYFNRATLDSLLAEGPAKGP